MNPIPRITDLTPAQQSALMDEARRRALALRAAAMDEAWAALGRRLRAAWRAARRTLGISPARRAVRP
jgi:hypothetical protein